jgi:Fe2+ or Zn2+ uptake regulation protein
LYDPETEPHYHFFCHRCGEVIDVEPLPECDLEGLLSRLTAGPLRGYKIERVEVYIHGLCAECSKKNGI